MQATSELEGLPPPRAAMGGPGVFEWVDQGRAEATLQPQDRRELVVWVWYPAAPDPDAERAATCPSRGRRVASSSAWTPPGC